jgi:DNA modification methylase
MADRDLCIEFSDDLVESFKSKEPVDGYTHNFYSYPARFSPKFPRAVMRDFSEPGDVVLDPFAGSGTTLVEALVNGRHAIGVDLNPIAHFISTVKTSVLTAEGEELLRKWGDKTIPKLNAQRPPETHDWWREEGYQKDLPWPVRKALEFALNEAKSIERRRLRLYARCSILRAGQQVLDRTRSLPSIGDFRAHFDESIDALIEGSSELRSTLNDRSLKPRCSSFQKDASSLTDKDLSHEFNRKPSLVITSPPYPGVHVLYHRWQVRGRRETPAPYWIIGTPDGHGASHYTMGSRTEKGIDDYFSKLEFTFSHLHSLLEENALVFQLVAFSDSAEQLPRFLEAMDEAGFTEVKPEGAALDQSSGRVTRRVPLRRWYASLQGKTSSTHEHLIVHRKTR